MEIEKDMAFPPKAEDKIKEKIEAIQLEKARIQSEAPSVGKFSLKKAGRQLMKEGLKAKA